MSLLGSAALAMWWDMPSEAMADFQDWHSHEHFPERLAIPGFRRSTRWIDACGGIGVFVLYEVETHATLSSAQYLARLNAPTAWSTRMMPFHHGMVRSQCNVLASHGGGVGRHAWTLRFAVGVQHAEAVQAGFASLAAKLAGRPGVIGAHLLRHQATAIATTTEQKIRNQSDGIAQWAFVATGYDINALRALATDALAERMPGAQIVDQVSGLYSLSHSAVPADVT
ncbi:MAG: hypothetical protein ABI190_01585 [Casimicrobiaceae bacterium]